MIHRRYHSYLRLRCSKPPFSGICSSLAAAGCGDALPTRRRTHQTQAGFGIRRKGIARFDGSERGAGGGELGLGRIAERGADLGSGCWFWRVNQVGSSDETVTSTTEPRLRLRLRKHPLGKRTLWCLQWRPSRATVGGKSSCYLGSEQFAVPKLHSPPLLSFD